MGSAASTVSDKLHNLCPNAKKQKPRAQEGGGPRLKDTFQNESVHEDEAQCNDTDPVKALEQKQDYILQRLGELKQTLDQLTNKYTVIPAASKQGTSSSAGTISKPVTKPTSAAQRQMKTGAGTPHQVLGNIIHDIVINADPEHPPLSLFVLHDQLKQQYRVLAKCYTHSSVKNVDPRLSKIFQNDDSVRRGDHQIALSVIWKKVENGPTLMVSAGSQTPIHGEVNIARYLNRLIDPDFDLKDVVDATLIDECLDIAQQQLLNGNSKEKAAALRGLNAKLGRKPWLAGTEFISLADIVTWSALHQTGLAEGAPNNVKFWIKALNDKVMFDTAVGLL